MKKNLLTVSLWGIYLLFLSCRPASNRQAVYNLSSTYKCNFLGADNKQ